MKKSRRKFLKKLSLSTPALAVLPHTLSSTSPASFQILKRSSPIPANDRIQVAAIGMGIMGFGNVKAALKTSGVELISVADCYKGRLIRSQEVFGQSVKTTQDYRELLNDQSTDAVVISSTDHWHATMAIECMKKGKPVYCEKPMVKDLEDGLEVIKVWKDTKVPFQVGSQFASNIVTHKARELYLEGKIGKLTAVEAYFDRFSALGAWQYSIPPNASTETIDWNMFLGGAPKIDFDPVRFFRWRNYQDYGTGIPGDLFVHLFTMLHSITGSQGPEKIYATGGLRYWKDGRDVADVMFGLFDYPENDLHPAFNLALRVNFVSGSGGKTGIRLVGSEGALDLGTNDLSIKRNKLPEAPGYGGWDSFDTFSESVQKDFVKQYHEKYGTPSAYVEEQGEQVFRGSDGYENDGMRIDHFADWFNAIRTGGKTIEDPEFGLRACGPAVASNISHYENRIIPWDPVGMKVLDKI
jgi:predicted dehydrogenase